MNEIIKGMANAAEAIQENFEELTGTIDAKITELTINKTFNAPSGGINTGSIELGMPVDDFRFIIVIISDPTNNTSFQAANVFPTRIGVNFLTYFYKGQYHNIRVTYTGTTLQILNNSSDESRIHRVVAMI